MMMAIANVVFGKTKSKDKVEEQRRHPMTVTRMPEDVSLASVVRVIGCVPKCSGWTKYYGGEITYVNSDGTYDIKFDDGERKRGVKESQIEGGSGVLDSLMEGDRDRVSSRRRGEGDRVLVFGRQHASKDFRLEHGVAIDDHERLVHLVAHDPAGAQVVAVGVEGVVRGAYGHAALLIVLVHHGLNFLGMETGSHHHLAGARFLERGKLPTERGFLADREDALGGFFRQG